MIGYSPDYGARPIKREIRNIVEDRISEMIIKNLIDDGSSIKISPNKNSILIEII